MDTHVESVCPDFCRGHGKSFIRAPRWGPNAGKNKRRFVRPQVREIALLDQTPHSKYCSFWKSVFRNNFVLKRRLSGLEEEGV